MLMQDLWHKGDRLVDLFCHSQALGYPLPSLREEFREVRRSILHSPRGFEDFSSLRDAKFLHSEVTARKVGWIAFHTPGGQLISVSPKIVHFRDGVTYSPIVEQLAACGVIRAEPKLERFFKRRAASKFGSAERLEAIVLNHAEKTVYLVKGVAASQVLKKSGAVPWSEYAPLWHSQGRVLGNVRVPGKSLNTLLWAKELLEDVLAGYAVRQLFFVVDDGYGWNFQAYQVPLASGKWSPRDEVLLDELPLFDSSLSFSDKLARNPDYLMGLPQGLRGADLRAILKVCPRDRCTRSMMMLYELVERQRQSPESLAVVDAAELGKSVEEQYGFAYTIDARRHDLEDCLRACGLAKRSLYRVNSYAASHVGVSRILTMIHKYNPMCPTSSDNVLDISMNQMLRWKDDAGDMFV